jgi:hypothetical protein
MSSRYGDVEEKEYRLAVHGGQKLLKLGRRYILQNDGALGMKQTM